ncbi:hypothetical protein [Sphingobacterium sp. T2]|nr:hypothetical protein [Sphingobacterium sp. T2]
MKKVLLSVGAALLLAVGAQAQTGFGLKAGSYFTFLQLWKYR